MDSGFEASDDVSPLDVSSGGKFFLIRLPKDVDVEILQGRKFSIKAESESDKIVDQISRDSKLFNIRLDQDVRLGYCNTVRPVIKNSIGETSCLGPEFAGILSVEQSFSQLQPVSTADIPITAYRKLAQVGGLTVRSMPRGSHSTVADLEQRQNENKVRARSSAGTSEGSGKKKRRSEGGSSVKEKIFIKEEIIKEEVISKSPSKKSKKDKKEKKEHKEHKEEGQEKKKKNHKKETKK